MLPERFKAGLDAVETFVALVGEPFDGRPDLAAKADGGLRGLFQPAEAALNLIETLLKGIIKHRYTLCRLRPIFSAPNEQ